MSGGMFTLPEVTANGLGVATGGLDAGNATGAADDAAGDVGGVEESEAVTGGGVGNLGADAGASAGLVGASFFSASHSGVGA